MMKWGCRIAGLGSAGRGPLFDLGRKVAVAGFAIGGCSTVVEFDRPDGTSTGSPGPDTAGSTSLLTTADPSPDSESGADNSSSTSPSDPSSSTSDDASETGCSFLGCDRPPPIEECDYYQQDCPKAQKCVAWANDGGTVLNAMRCVPVVPDPVGIDEVCSTLGDQVSGFDNCDFGLVCRHVDPATQQGICLAMCVGSPEDPSCADGCSLCVGASAGESFLCMQQCDPVLQDCPPGHGCYPQWGDHFMCGPDVVGETIEVGDVCEYTTACPAGAVCLPAESVPGCEGDQCCASFCSTEDPDACDEVADSTCVPWDPKPSEGCATTVGIGFCGVP